MNGASQNMALTLIDLCPFLPLYANLRIRYFYRNCDWSIGITCVRDDGVNDCDICFTRLRKRGSLLLRFSGIARVRRNEKTKPMLDHFCHMLPYVRFYPTLP